MKPIHSTRARNKGPNRLVLRGGLLLGGALLVGALGGWTDRTRATDGERDVAFAGGTVEEQLEAARGEVALARVQLERAQTVLDNSARYQIPADLSAAIYDIALSEGIDPALGYRLVKVESNFKRDARSSAGALGYTQLQLPTARYYKPNVSEAQLLTRDVSLRLGFRFLKDLLEKYDGDTRLALLAYNRGPARVQQILAAGGNPGNGYASAVLNGYRPLLTDGSAETEGAGAD